MVRERNFYREGDITHYGQAVKDAGRIETIWTQLQKSSAFREAPQQRSTNSTPHHPHRKRGLAITPVKFGISFTATFFNQGGALVLIYRDGSVQVNHGGTEMGQGLHTKIAADRGGGPGCSSGSDPRDADAHRQSSEHLGDGGVGEHGSEWRRGVGRVHSIAGTAASRGGGIAAV